ncbi:MAG: orotidine-5'-phosphate decarboxylase [Helicobacteraceae bacterium]|nr:orotidine-5'-phosphate decarboxylase [Helicobacteraceae bacterium]
MKLCAALDCESAEKNLAIVKKLRSLDLWFKIGLSGFIRDGWKFVNEVKRVSGAPIFMDLKLYDIPNTISDAALAIAEGGADMFNVHASAGVKAMSAVMERLSALKTRPLVLAVTALTSFSADEFAEIYNRSVEGGAVEMARSARNAGLDGVVCSAYESRAIKSVCGDDFITLCPGIRFEGGETNDQSRVATPQTAALEKCDFIVMGRAILSSTDPKAAALKALSAIC